jgi:O-antigen ligase
MKSFYFILLLLAYMIQGVLPLKLQFGYGLNIQNLVAYLVLIALLMSDFSTRKVIGKKIPGIWLILISATYVVINIVLSQFASQFHYPLIEHVAQFKRSFLDPVALYVMAFLLADSKDDAFRFLIIIVVSFALLNAFNLIVLFVHPTQLSLQYNRFEGFGNANKTAYLLCFMMPFAYYFYRMLTKNMAKLFFLVLISLTVVTVALSGSRGGLLALSLILLFMVFIFRDYKILLAFILMLPVVVFVLWDNNFFQETLSRLSQFSYKSLEDASSNRFDIWRNIIQTIFSSPIYFLMGTGFDTAIVVGRGANAHNMYLKTALELGLFGFLLFITTIVRIVIYVIKHPIADKKYKQALLAAISVVFMAWQFSSLQGVLNFFALTTGMAMTYFAYLSREEEIFRKEKKLCHLWASDGVA